MEKNKKEEKEKKQDLIYRISGAGHCHFEEKCHRSLYYYMHFHSTSFSSLQIV